MHPALARCQAPLKALDLGLLLYLIQKVRQPRLLAVKWGSQNPSPASFYKCLRMRKKKGLFGIFRGMGFGVWCLAH